MVELIGSKATAGKFCTRSFQARRARSDAPYHAGLAAELFDFTAHFGFPVIFPFVILVFFVVNQSGSHRKGRTNGAASQ